MGQVVWLKEAVGKDCLKARCSESKMYASFSNADEFLSKK